MVFAIFCASSASHTAQRSNRLGVPVMVEIVNDTFNVHGVPFRFAVGPGLTTADEAFIFKDRGLIDLYLEHLSTFAPRNVLEFGIFQGGSAALLATVLGLEQIACIDICNPLPGLEAFLERHALSNRVRCHFNTSQADGKRVRAIVKEVFGDNPSTWSSMTVHTSMSLARSRLRSCSRSCARAASTCWRTGHGHTGLECRPPTAAGITGSRCPTLCLSG